MAAESLSDRILRENDAVLGAMLSHRFVEDVKNDRLSKEAFQRYLVYEGAFVDSAISIFAYAAATANTMPQKRWLIAVLDALANEQIAYFERTFASRCIDPSSFDTGIAEVETFRAGMLEIARQGGFLDTVAAMFAAEWMYWTWCRQAASRPISDPLLKEWVDMHVDPNFAAQAQWLKNELDVAGETLEEDEKARLSAIFDRAMQLEIDFHDAPYL
ncbi:MULTISPECIES: TenA family protein [Rhizobium]|uniref:TenA family protein n=1 Tax=Rhizobium TaxID=379 RepID=UPI001C921C45|nr:MULTISPECIES: TenA family protein [Rhizobium]MBY3121641.1 TenA family transcriptional regulator [Rhizobium laguerreae]MBY3133925.1 TenA family transcriptional regulator [Rhizobium laguerreae]MBY3156723.1 TenA family transcriptional regulator [Rhizobium laguerreae]MBY3191457.1 TenA family transcriptional regulator [Rhizobium laguerreae]MBY3209926.1 TenA family transcriptional regulator [Rhizobium laguerreae]